MYDLGKANKATWCIVVCLLFNLPELSLLAGLMRNSQLFICSDIYVFKKSNALFTYRFLDVPLRWRRIFALFLCIYLTVCKKLR